MSTYTLRGSEALDAQINLHLEHIIRTVSPHCEALVLIGGYARGEGTPFIKPDGSEVPFNDYDLVAVVDQADSHIRAAFRMLEQQLTQDIGLPVDLCPYRLQRLPHCEFSLLNYEMKNGHKVIWGDEHVLDPVPAISQDAIPRSEGTRLLLNRGKLLLDVRLRLADPAPLSDEECIRLLKFIYKAWLAMGDAVLLSERKYDILYAVKRERIASIGGIPHRDAVIEGYLQAIELRTRGDYHRLLPDTDIQQEFQRLRAVFLDVFAWQREQHASRECPMLKAMLLNLKWNRWPYMKHPRTRLYDALPELLKDHPDNVLLRRILACSGHFENRFYQLQARFS